MIRYILLFLLISTFSYSQSEQIISEAEINGFETVEFGVTKTSGKFYYFISLWFDNDQIFFSSSSLLNKNQMIQDYTQFIKDLELLYDYLDNPKNDYFNINREDYNLVIYNESSSLIVYPTTYNLDTGIFSVNKRNKTTLSLNDVLDLIDWLKSLTFDFKESFFEDLEPILSEIEIEDVLTAELVHIIKDKEYDLDISWCKIQENGKTYKCGSIMIWDERSKFLSDLNLLISSFKTCLKYMEKTDLIYESEPKCSYNIISFCFFEIKNNSTDLHIYDLKYNKEKDRYDKQIKTVISKNNLIKLIDWLDNLSDLIN